MRLKKIQYSQYGGTEREWSLQEMPLGDINLLVGRNATGKTRSLNIINALANLLSGKKKPVYLSGHYDVTFEDNAAPYHYVLEYKDAKVTEERLEVGREEVLRRGAGGFGKIRAEKIHDSLDFQTPDSELAVVARRDSIQHPFFEPLHQWAASLRHYAFGSTLGQDVGAIPGKEKHAEVDPKNFTQVNAVFNDGVARFGEEFKQRVIADMGKVGYELESISVRPPISVMISGSIGEHIVCLSVKENDLATETDQLDMSQGMFRALSLVIQLNYSEMTSQGWCVLVDDIGEGLDFERSCALIDLLMAKAKASSLQLIMATNDRFVMNRVPLEYWSILQRHGSQCKVFNYSNARARFDEFRFTGLSNFDFFAVDFLGEERVASE